LGAVRNRAGLILPPSAQAIGASPSGKAGDSGSAGDSRKIDNWIIAQRCDGFQRRVASALGGPFVVLFD